METQKIKITVRPIKSVRELQVYEGGRWQRRIGAVYFHQLDDGNFIIHLVTDQTDGEWLIRMSNKKRIYVPVESIQAEGR